MEEEAERLQERNVYGSKKIVFKTQQDWYTFKRTETVAAWIRPAQTLTRWSASKEWEMDMSSHLILRWFLQLILFGKGKIRFLQWNFTGYNYASGQVLWTTQNELSASFIDFHFVFSFFALLVFCLFILTSTFRFLCIYCFIFICFLALKREEKNIELGG